MIFPLVLCSRISKFKIKPGIQQDVWTKIVLRLFVFMCLLIKGVMVNALLWGVDRNCLSNPFILFSLSMNKEKEIQKHTPEKHAQKIHVQEGCFTCGRVIQLRTVKF